MTLLARTKRSAFLAAAVLLAAALLAACSGTETADTSNADAAAPVAPTTLPAATTTSLPDDISNIDEQSLPGSVRVTANEAGDRHALRYYPVDNYERDNTNIATPNFDDAPCLADFQTGADVDSNGVAILDEEGNPTYNCVEEVTARELENLLTDEDFIEGVVLDTLENLDSEVSGGQ